MVKEDFKRPQRVWINNPSTLQPHHKLHSKVGIAVLEECKDNFSVVRIYFTEGVVISMFIDPKYLSR